MKTLVSILSFILMIVCIGFSDFFALDQEHDVDKLLKEEHCDIDTTSIKLITKLEQKFRKLNQNKLWSVEKIRDSCDQKELSLMIKQMIENNFSTRKVASGRLSIVKESLTCKN